MELPVQIFISHDSMYNVISFRFHIHVDLQRPLTSRPFHILLLYLAAVTSSISIHSMLFVSCCCCHIISFHPFNVVRLFVLSHNQFPSIPCCLFLPAAILPISIHFLFIRNHIFFGLFCLMFILAGLQVIMSTNKLFTIKCKLHTMVRLLRFEKICTHTYRAQHIYHFSN